MQELNSCIRILDDWSVDVDKLREAELRLGEHEDNLRNLEAEQSDLKDRIEVRSYRFASPPLHRSLSHCLQLLERRISNGREELTRMKDKMERKREAAKGRKRDLELQHATSIEEKRHLDDEAFKKNLEAQAVEQHVSHARAAKPLYGSFIDPLPLADPRDVYLSEHRARQGREGVQAHQGADQCVFCLAPAYAQY